MSGGPDSMAMLVLAHAADLPIRVATVDHGLRAEAADEAALVAQACVERGIVHTTLRPDPPLAPGGNIQARARTVRYNLLATHARSTGCAAILTAHHRDDQAETLLMRANRGSGVRGLAGVRARGEWNGVTLLRPLLGWSRNELAEVAKGAVIAVVHDPANHDPAHDRTHVRALLASDRWLDPGGLARSAAALADAAEALDWSMARLSIERMRREGDTLRIDAAGLPREYRRRLLAIALGEFGATQPRGPELDRLLEKLDAGDAGTLGQSHVTLDGTFWQVAFAPPRRAIKSR